MGHVSGNCQWVGQCQRMVSLLPPGHLPSFLTVFAANLSLKPRVTAHGEQPAYQGPVHCIATIVRTDGLVGLYRGTSAMLLRDVPGYCLYFIPYVFLSEWITPEACASPSPCAAWLAGGMAGKDGSPDACPLAHCCGGTAGELPCPLSPGRGAHSATHPGFFIKSLL